MKKKLFQLLYILVFVLLVFLGLELYFAFLLNNPDSCPDSWKENLIAYYRDRDEVYIQQQPEMAIYDAELFYTLKPGKFVFENREYTTTYVVNSIGVRDDEASLLFPKIVMLGDSYGMGFGVEQDETYAQICEKKLKVNVLNAGISSYGTPREIELLKRVNTDSMDYLIVQYCPNDFAELTAYIRADNKLEVSSEHVYDSICEIVQDRSSYYPFKHVRNFLPMLFKEEPEVVSNKTPDTLKPVNAPKGFIELLRSANHIPVTTKIIVFTLGNQGYSNYFLKSVEHEIGKEFFSSLQDRLIFLDFSDKLETEHYFTLDNHINAKGHQLVADALVDFIQAESLKSNTKTINYPSGKLCVRAQYKGRLKDGLTEYYWENGMLSQTVEYKNGQKHGKEISYSKTGELVQQRTFFRNKAVE